LSKSKRVCPKKIVPAIFGALTKAFGKFQKSQRRPLCQNYPDLQVFNKNLTKLLSGKKVKSVSLNNRTKVKMPKGKFESALVGKKVSKVKRVGKELHIVFTSGDVLSLHMMLHGQLNFYEEEHEKKYAVVDIHFSDKTGLVMTDFQGAATPRDKP
jgi:formamidopyrimidine-DNA glycosylase